MKRQALLALSIGFLLGADAPKEAMVKRDLEKLRGTWQLVSTEPTGDTLKYRRHLLRIEGQELVYIWDLNSSRPSVRRQRFQIDPTAHPRAIDIDDEVIRATGQKIPITVPGIYTLDGDTLKLFLNRVGRRPRSFDTTAQRGNGVLYIYRRQQGDRPNKPNSNGAKRAGSAERKDMVSTGVVKEINSTAILLRGGERFALDRQTRYAIETGRDPLEARHSDVTPGKRVTITWRSEGGRRVAVLVLVDMVQPADQVPEAPGGQTRVEELRKKYAGRIRPGRTGAAALRSSRAMKELVDEWGPEGATVEQLEHLVGSPADRGKEGVASYRFDTGFGGQVWVFQTKDGKIIGWRVEQLE